MEPCAVNHLFVIDNPGHRPLDEDTSWLNELLESASGNDSVWLMGFSDRDLMRIRRRLSSCLGEEAIHSLTHEVEASLDAVGDELLALAMARGIDGIQADAVHWIGHACQTPRQAECQSHASALGSTHPANDRDPSESQGRPRLAFISPLPPEPTGIADYSAELLPYLADDYDITLVAEQPKVASSLARRFPVIDSDTFMEQAQDFQRVLYQVGNSPFHVYQFGLLRSYPGVIVLHDVFLFDAVWWMQESQAWPDGLRQQLFHDHGFPALCALENAGAKDDGSRGPEEYPVSGFVTDEAAGLIVHSDYARRLDRHWRPDSIQEPAAVIPHLRELPPRPGREARLLARKALGIDEKTRLIASFGGISPKKMTDVIVDAVLDGDVDQSQDVHLVLVGAQHGGDFGRRLTQLLRTHTNRARVSVTGYVDPARYRLWLQAADIAVQLRQQSRGESSGAIYDVMAHGLALVVNAHGSSTELPEKAVECLPEQVTAQQLWERLRALMDDPARQAVLGEAARAYVAERLDPASVARRYRDVIERAARHCRRVRRDRWLDRLAAVPALRSADASSRLRATRALCEVDTTAPLRAPRLFIDVSTIAWHDLKTGIERVTRRIADHLLRHPPAGWRVELIRWGGDDFHLARGFASDQLGIAPPAPDRPCEARAGDIYVTLEWAPPLLEQAGHALRRMRARGVRCYFTVHDLLPLQLPHCFPEETPATMRRWFDGIAALADGITCVSAQVAGDVRRELHELSLEHPPWVQHFHLGADFSGQASPSEPTLAGQDELLLRRIKQAGGATLLMVGTLEPRKGHRQVLEGLERLWQHGADINLVIVGKQGWDVATLAARIQRHPQRGQRLFWVEGASDALLEALYGTSDGLLAASLGEGFGLPLIEAAHHRIPILARDIPVFREVAGSHADYFHAENPEEMAAALEEWHTKWQAGAVTPSHGMPFQSWSQSAQQWIGLILADRGSNQRKAPTEEESVT